MLKIPVLAHGLVAALLVPVAAPAQGTIQEILKEYAKADKEWLAAYGDAPEEDRTRLRQNRPWPSKWCDRLLQAIQAEPEADSALQAATWIITKRAAKGVKLDPVIGVLQQHHLAAPDLQGVMSSLSRVPSEASLGFLRSLEAKSPHDKIRAFACFYLAGATKRRAAMARLMKSDEKVMESYTKLYGKKTVAALEDREPADWEKAAEALYVKLQETPTYAGTRYGQATLKEAVVVDLYELRNLAIGKVAPSIVGEDIDGNPMKLSDYRGKVVVLDFWGDW